MSQDGPIGAAPGGGVTLGQVQALVDGAAAMVPWTGNGASGALNVTGNTTLVSVGNYTDITIQSGGRLDSDGYPLILTGTMTGLNGGRYESGLKSVRNASGGSGAPNSITIIYRRLGGGGNAGAAGAPGAVGADNSSTDAYLGAAGGNGGISATQLGGAGQAVSGALGTLYGSPQPLALLLGIAVRNATVRKWAGGGGGGGGGGPIAGSGSGGGGGGGPVMVIAAGAIDWQVGFLADASGGDGQGTATANAAGGGGGGGGFIGLIAPNITLGAGSYTVAGGVGGVSGAGAIGPGQNGSNGTLMEFKTRLPI